MIYINAVSGEMYCADLWEGVKKFNTVKDLEVILIENDRLKQADLEVVLENKCESFCFHRNPYECSHIEKLIEDDNQLYSFREIYPIQSYPKCNEAENKCDQLIQFIVKYIHSIKNLRIIGGEPFIQSSFTRLLNQLRDKKFKIHLIVESKLQVGKSELNQILKLIEGLNSQGLKSFTIEIASGVLKEKYFEFLNYGSTYKNVRDNLKFISKKYKSIKINYRHLYSIFSYKTLPQHVEFIKNECKGGLFWRINKKNYSSINFLYHTQKLDASFTPEILKSSLQKFLSEIKNQWLLNVNHKEALRILDNTKEINELNFKIHMNYFFIVIDYLNSMSKVSFNKLFPELIEHYEESLKYFYDPNSASQSSRISKIKHKMDEVSPTLCLAKWNHSTIHLHSGQSHSCHHPPPHNIDKDKLISNPGVIHNTSEKIKQRKLMRAGKKPEGCSYCWDVEKNKDSISDRLIKSSESWAAPYLQDLKNKKIDKNINPKYLELSFSSKCNLKCSYCHPFVSHGLLKEYIEFGKWPHEEYSILDVEDCKEIINIKQDENPYIDAFWKWFPDVYEDLHVLRITGGEPFMSINTFKLLEYIKSNKNKKLEVSINTNLSFNPQKFSQIEHTIEETLSSEHINKLVMWCSIDTFGEQASYIRDGLNLDYFVNNMRSLEKYDKLEIKYMCTLNVLSLPRLINLLEFVLDHKKRSKQKVDISFSYLHNPTHQSVFIANDSLFSHLVDALDFLKRNNNYFKEYEYIVLENVIKMKDEKQIEIDLTKERVNFYKFFKEYDQRRNLDILKSFPEMSCFWDECKKLADND